MVKNEYIQHEMTVTQDEHFSCEILVTFVFFFFLFKDLGPLAHSETVDLINLSH
jgi:hypothetical protein